MECRLDARSSSRATSSPSSSASVIGGGGGVEGAGDEEMEGCPTAVEAVLALPVIAAFCFSSSSAIDGCGTELALPLRLSEKDAQVSCSSFRFSSARSACCCCLRPEERKQTKRQLFAYSNAAEW